MIAGAAASMAGLLVVVRRPKQTRGPTDEQELELT